MKIYLNINEVSNMTGIPQKTIRHYRAEFIRFFDKRQRHGRTYSITDTDLILRIGKLARVMNHIGINEVLQGKIKIEGA